ncbi:MAG: glycosyltransferase family 2 protein [Candidatus Omnitrophota bacterium]|jgi:glycosyltransferase involved in cell wall biosynthesis
MKTPLLSIIVPVYNEANTIKGIIEKINSVNIDKEIIVVDDASSDGTSKALSEIKSENIRVFRHDKNRGKGGAIVTGLAGARGKFVIPQDADREYNPRDLPALVGYAVNNNLSVVYGSRFLKGRGLTSLSHYLGNKFLTGLTNILFNASLTDMETCYKLVSSDLMKELNIRAERFEVEPEITAKILKKGYKIAEIPVSYHPRYYSEGKKISWKDGISSIWCLIRLRLTKGHP